ncbi:retrovirus-related Pol polyprotein from transposon opus [Trichonephila clavipes]|nr:retrovirus-related Pol polyprotein from transposon opus [Trichonephila clavipes]
MSALDLRSGYFQMAVNPSDIVKTAFVTKNGTYAFRRMPFGLSGAAPNFQKAIDIILKPVIGKFVSIYMDDVIISSPSFTQHVKHLKEVFRLLHEAGLTLNKDKCKFGCEELKYLGLIINKEGIKTDETKVQAIVEMKPPHNSKEVSKFLGMSQWLVEGLLFYAKYATSLGEMRVYIPKSVRNEIMREFHDKPLAGHFGRFKTYHKIRPQANRTERDLVQMIANYVNEQHDTCDQFLREFAYAIRTAVNETGKTPAELFLGRKLITPFQKLVMVSDGTEFAVGDIERLFEEARRNTESKHENWKKYYNRRRRDVQIKVNDWVLVATHHLSSATRKVVAKFKPKFEGPYRVLDVKNNNVVIWKAGKRLTINVDQVRIYRHRKCDETEIGTGNLDNGSLHDESSGFDRGQRDGKKKGSETRIGKREESRPTIERKAQQGGPVRSRKGRERNDSPYIEERTRSSNKNARRGGDQQRQDQERRGTWTKKSLSLEVLSFGSDLGQRGRVEILSSGSSSLSLSLAGLSTSNYGCVHFGFYRLTSSRRRVREMVVVVGRLGNASRRQCPLAHGGSPTLEAGFGKTRAALA